MFVRTLAGTLVNLDHVVEIDPFKVEGKEPKYRAWLRDGDRNVLGEIKFDWVEVENLTKPVPVFIPSWPNTKGVLLTRNGDEVEAEDCEILGWQIDPKKDEICQAIPVVIEHPCSNQKLLIRLPNGNLYEEHVGEYETVERAKESFRERGDA
jgi:hypothetical protein